MNWYSYKTAFNSYPTNNNTTTRTQHNSKMASSNMTLKESKKGPCSIYPWIDVSKYKEPETQAPTQAQTQKTQISIESIKEECKTEIKTTQSVSQVNQLRSIHYHNDFNLNDPWQARVAASSP
jgi:hypothetical protein